MILGFCVSPRYCSIGDLTCLPDNLALKSGELLSASLAVSLSVEKYTFR